MLDYHHFNRINNKKIEEKQGSPNKNNFIEQQFECIQCKKSFHNKSNLNRHNKMMHDLNLSIDTSTYLINDSDYYSESDNNSLKQLLLEDLKGNIIITNFENKNSLKCEYCYKKFSRSDNLKRHEQNYCKKRHDYTKEKILNYLMEELDNMKDKFKLIEKENDKLKHIINTDDNKNYITEGDNTINILNQLNIKTLNQNINMINNSEIKLVAFGQEDLSFITDQVCMKILKKGFMAVPELAIIIHFNKNKPEYNNVYISNLRDNNAIIYDGTKWCITDRSQVIDQIVEDKSIF